MAGVGENIALLRRERDMTQEALGAQVGVSMQAVSKWENGGFPDAPLFPAIARALGVSIDALFGQEAAAGDLEQAIARDIAHRPMEERIRRAFELSWAMELSIGGGDEVNEHNSLTNFQGFDDGMYSRMLTEFGITLMRIDGQNHYLFLSPEPEGGWERRIAHPEAHTKLFALLSRRDAYDALMLLARRDRNPFTAKLLEKQLGVSPERANEILKAFSEYRLVDVGRLELDDEAVDVFTATPEPSLIGFLTFACEMAERPGSFSYHCGMRKSPWFRA